MRKIYFIIILISIISCEKDDICDPTTPTTPKLVINFYDAVTNSNKSITKLAVFEDSNTVPIEVFDAVNQIKIPIKTLADITKYRFVINYQNANTNLINEDKLQIDYARKDVYISRSCGFKTIFALTATPIKSDPIADGFWMQSITVSQPNITNENETHLKISFY